MTYQETSRAAYKASRQGRGEVQTVIHVLLQDRSSTDKEMEAITGIEHETLSGCRRAMVKKGLVEDSGEKRPTPRGNPAIVWRLVKK